MTEWAVEVTGGATPERYPAGLRQVLSLPRRRGRGAAPRALLRRLVVFRRCLFREEEVKHPVEGRAVENGVPAVEGRALDDHF